MPKEFGTEMYDAKYSRGEEQEPRPVVTSFVDQFVTSGQRCLDLGCGAGRHSRYMVERGIHVTAVDRSEQGVKRTRELLKGDPESQAIIADIHHMPFNEDYFDSVVSNRVLDYNDDAGLEEAFKELERVTKEHGLILITVRSNSQTIKENEVLVDENENGGKTYRAKEGKEEGALQHYFSEKEIRALAAKHNFQIQELNEKKNTDDMDETDAVWHVILKRKTLGE